MYPTRQPDRLGELELGCRAGSRWLARQIDRSINASTRREVQAHPTAARQVSAGGRAPSTRIQLESIIHPLGQPSTTPTPWAVRWHTSPACLRVLAPVRSLQLMRSNLASQTIERLVTGGQRRVRVCALPATTSPTSTCANAKTKAYIHLGLSMRDPSVRAYVLQRLLSPTNLRDCFRRPWLPPTNHETTARLTN